MNLSGDDKRELYERLWRLRDHSALPEDVEWIERLAAENAEVRVVVARFAVMCGMLHWARRRPRAIALGAGEYAGHCPTRLPSHPRQFVPRLRRLLAPRRTPGLSDRHRDLRAGAIDRLVYAGFALRSGRQEPRRRRQALGALPSKSWLAESPAWSIAGGRMMNAE